MIRRSIAKPAIRSFNSDASNSLEYLKLEDRRVLNGDVGTISIGWDILDEETQINDQGLIVSQNLLVDTDGDQVADLRTMEQFSYDESGNQMTYQRVEDWGADGIVNFMSRWTYTYGDEGQLVSGINELDYDGDGVIDDVFEEFFDYADPVIVDPRITADETFDDDGRLLHGSYFYDYENDGIDDYWEAFTHTYLADGQLESTRVEMDYEADGTIDYISFATFEYDHEGTLIAVHNQIDEDGDGEFDLSYTDDLTGSSGPWGDGYPEAYATSGTPRDQQNALNLSVVGQTYFRQVLNSTNAETEKQLVLVNPFAMSLSTPSLMSGTATNSLDDSGLENKSFKLVRRTRKADKIDNNDESIEEIKVEAIQVAQQPESEFTENKTATN